jgi:hypothetical protein
MARASSWHLWLGTARDGIANSLCRAPSDLAGNHFAILAGTQWSQQVTAVLMHPLSAPGIPLWPADLSGICRVTLCRQTLQSCSLASVYRRRSGASRNYAYRALSVRWTIASRSSSTLFCMLFCTLQHQRQNWLSDLNWSAIKILEHVRSANIGSNPPSRSCDDTPAVDRALKWRHLRRFVTY